MNNISAENSYFKYHIESTELTINHQQLTIYYLFIIHNQKFAYYLIYSGATKLFHKLMQRTFLW